MNITVFLDCTLVLSNFAKDLVKTTFSKVDTLYLVGGLQSNLHMVLADAQKTAYVITIDHEVNASWLTPRGYVASLGSPEELEATFRDFSRFKPYNRVLLICPKCPQSQVNIVTRNARYHALEISTGVRPSSLQKVTLKQQQVKILYFDYYPFVMTERPGRPYGLDTNIISHVFSGWNVEYVKNNVTRWDAMLGALKDGLANMTITAHWHSLSSRLGFEISYPYLGSSSTFLVPRPTAKPFALALLQTLKPTVWLLVLLTIITFSSFTYLVSQVKDVQNYTYMHFLLEATCILTLNSQQGVYHSKILKTIFLTWSIYAVILGVSYSAPLVALQTNPTLVNVINTFEDLCNHGIVCYVNNIFHKNILINSYNSYQKQYANYIRQVDENFVTKKQSYATDVWLNKYLSKQYVPYIPSEYFQLLKEDYQYVYLVVVFPKNSPFTKMFQHKVMTLTESGIIEAWIDNLFLENITNVYHHSAFFNHLVVRKTRKRTVKDMSVAFYVLILGSVLSWLCFAAETLRNRGIILS